MRTIQFDRQFDVIAIPDSIANKVSEKDLLQVITNSVSHLKTGGIFIVVAKPEETFIWKETDIAKIQLGLLRVIVSILKLEKMKCS